MMADHVRLQVQKKAVNRAIQHKLVAMMKKYKDKVADKAGGSAGAEVLAGPVATCTTFKGDSDDEVPEELGQDSDLDLKNELLVLREIRQRKH